MRYLLLASSLLLGPLTSAHAQVGVGVGIAVPGVNIGINVPAYPELVRVPGYPVYYAPQANGNYFFYDGLYWVYAGDAWYASSWYNGPWYLVGPERVPLYVLRVPVRYYRAPPPYFHGWRADRPPRWGQHWGHDWERRRPGWDRWDRRRAPRPAPLPVYQQQYYGDRYPHEAEQRRSIRAENYRYQPRERVTRQHYQQGQPARPPAGPPRQAPGPQRYPAPRGQQMQPSQPQPQPQRHPPQPGPRDRGRDRGEERGPDRR
jgi:hypothetical protein